MRDLLKEVLLDMVLVVLNLFRTSKVLWHPVHFLVLKWDPPNSQLAKLPWSEIPTVWAVRQQ